MNVRSIDAFWDRKTRNDINYNFDFLSKSHRIIQTQLNDLVLQEGNSPLEVRQARGGHQVLADRLNSTDQQLAQTTDEVKDLKEDKADTTYVNNELMKKVDQVMFNHTEFTMDFYGNGAILFSVDITETSNASAVQEYIDTLVSDGLIEGVTLADESVTTDKRTVLGDAVNVVVNTAVSHPDINTINNTVTFFSGTFFYWRKRRQYISGDYVVDYSDIWNDGNTIPSLYYNVKTNTIRAIPSDQLLNISEDEMFLMALLKTWDGKLKYVNADFPFTIDGKNPNEEEIVILSSVGAVGHIGLRPNSPRLNIDNNSKTLFIPSGAAIYYRNGRYTVPEDTTIQFLSGSASLRQHVYYNIASGNFIVRRGLHATQTVENDILLLTIEWLDNNQNTLTNVWTTCDYTINGKNPIESQIERVVDDKIGDLEESAFTFAPTILTTDYQSSEGDYPAILNSDEYHSLFEQLINDHPDFLSRKLKGKDETGQYDIYEYHAGGSQIDPPGELKPRPKGIFTGGVHGYERTSPIALYYFFKDVCENWQSDSDLEYIRWNIDIVFNPIANPHGYNTTNRVNGNSVDINRNFPSGWVATDPEGTNYSGDSPASEIETQYIMDMLDEHQDALFYIDFHTNGSTRVYDDYTQMFWWLMNSGFGVNKDITTAGKYTIEKMTRATIQRYDFPDNVGHFGHMTVAGGGGMAQRYGSSLGIPSTVIETFFNLPTEEGSFTPSYNAIRSSTDYVGIFLAALINQFKK